MTKAREHSRNAIDSENANGFSPAVPTRERLGLYPAKPMLRSRHGIDRPPFLQTARFGGCGLSRAVEAVVDRTPRPVGGGIILSSRPSCQ